MASSLSLLLLFSTLIGALTTTTARPGLPFHPCNTLLVSTYSFSLQPRRTTPDDIPNPNNDDNSNSHRPSEFFAVVTEVREFNPKIHRFFLNGPQFFPDGPQHQLPRSEGFIHRNDEETLIPRGIPFGSTSSLRERTVDILNVLAALLFGAACGALTAGTMYLIWSLFNNRFESYHREMDGFSDEDDYDNDDYEDEEDIFNPKKPNNNDFSKCVVVVPAPSSVTDSADTALLKKESV